MGDYMFNTRKRRKGDQKQWTTKIFTLKSQEAQCSSSRLAGKVLGKSSSCLSWNICVCCEHCTLSADKDTAQMDEIKKTTHELFAFKMFCRYSSLWTQIRPFQVFSIIVEFLTDKNSKKSSISFANIFSVCQGQIWSRLFIITQV